MTRAPDPADSADIGLPRDPADYSLRRRGLGLGFWIGIIFTGLCVVAGVTISRYGPVLWPVKAARPAAISPPATPGPTVAPAADQAAPPPPAARALAPPLPSPEVMALSGRLDRLESDQRRSARAAAEALAAAELSEAAQASQPFAGQLAGIDRLLPDSAELRDLRQLAATGAPSRPALAAELAGLADRAAVAARAPAAGAGLLAHLTHALAAVFTLRRVDRVTGGDPDAVLARAQQHANDGDIEGALKSLDALPRGGQTALADWRLQAQRRIAIDRHVAALRTAALRDLGPVAEAWAAP